MSRPPRRSSLYIYTRARAVAIPHVLRLKQLPAGIESFSIRDNDSGLEYDAVRYYANDATEHSVVHLADGGAEVAYSFDGEHTLSVQA